MGCTRRKIGWEWRRRGVAAGGGGSGGGDVCVKGVEVTLATRKASREPQMPKGYTIEQEGGDLGIRVRPIESVGVYVPGGSAGYMSSLLMAVVPGRVAGG